MIDGSYDEQLDGQINPAFITTKSRENKMKSN